jgi:hypothetical protein
MMTKDLRGTHIGVFWRCEDDDIELQKYLRLIM